MRGRAGAAVVVATMFRNQYDNDTTTWSPQGRIHQVEYAMESIKQGSCAVGLKSKTHAVIVALKRSANELSSHQKKLFCIDGHVGIAIAGLTSDARMLSTYMRDECLTNKFVFDEPLPVSRLVASVAEKMQTPTLQYGRRPYGVGFLVAGVDEQGPHIYQTCPSSNYYSCKAMAIGARYQSAKTYLERGIDKFETATPDELLLHGLKALRESLAGDVSLTVDNCAAGIVSADAKFRVVEGTDLASLIEQISTPAQAADAGDQAAPAAAADEPMEG